MRRAGCAPCSRQSGARRAPPTKKPRIPSSNRCGGKSAERGSRSSLTRIFAPAEIGWLINRIRERAFLVKRLPKVDVADDPGDNYLLAMAAAGDAQYLVTGDKSDLLALKQYRGTQLVTVQQLAQLPQLEGVNRVDSKS
jgi:hypothetical protein